MPSLEIARAGDLLRLLDHVDDGDPLPPGGRALLSTVADQLDQIIDRLDAQEQDA